MFEWSSSLSNIWSDFVFSCVNLHLSITYTCNTCYFFNSASFVCHIFCHSGMTNHEHWCTDWRLFFLVILVHLFLFAMKSPLIRNYIYAYNCKPQTHTSCINWHFPLPLFVFMLTWMVPSFWCVCADKSLFLLNFMYVHCICAMHNLAMKSEFCTSRILLVKTQKFGPIFIHHILFLQLTLLLVNRCTWKSSCIVVSGALCYTNLF